MGETTVDHILQQVRKLSLEERLLLQTQLDELLEGEWQEEADSARRIARERNIDQEAIDQAVHRVRYGL